MNVQIKLLRPTSIAPKYATSGSAGADVFACIDEPYVLEPGQRYIVPCGFSAILAPGYEVQMRARSGLSSKFGICLANGVGTVDSDYRGEYGAILLNLGKESFTIEPGMRIAQMVIARYEQAEWQVVDELDETERGIGGYGSTGH